MPCFVAGQKLLCINDNGGEINFLVKGNIYKFIDYDIPREFIICKGITRDGFERIGEGWRARRFKEVPMNIDPWWLTSDVVRLVNTIRDTNNWSLSLILADALMDSGCDENEMFLHLQHAEKRMKDMKDFKLICGCLQDLFRAVEKPALQKEVEMMRQEMGEYLFYNEPQCREGSRYAKK